MFSELVWNKLDHLPTSPGCYLFKDHEKTVVYVGKAKNLRSRVRSYFQEGTSDTRYFVPLLHSLLEDIETIVTHTERDALLLENSLIKHYLPKFNVRLRDGKNYLSLKLTLKDKWPRLLAVRKREKDGSRYFGPYHSQTAARYTQHLINKHFQLRTCSDKEMASRKRPCLQYQIKRCPAPCVFEVDPEFYSEQVQTVALFLDGKHDDLLRQIQERMNIASSHMAFELAGIYRDQMRAVELTREKQQSAMSDAKDRDVIGFYREGDAIEICVLFVRAGLFRDMDTFTLKQVEIPTDEALYAFISSYYKVCEDEFGAAIPGEILLPIELESMETLSEILSEKAKKKVEVLTPKRGEKASILILATNNAKHAYEEKNRNQKSMEERLLQMQQKLRLPVLPKTIECCDISHFGGKNTVGAVVRFDAGVPDKSKYKCFHVKGKTGEGAGGDDYLAMYEVLKRRFLRGKTSKNEKTEGHDQAKFGDQKMPFDLKRSSFWDLPDLFVVDGGKGQLRVALTAAKDLGLEDLNVVSIAKEKENHAGEVLVDRIYLPGQKNPISVQKWNSLFILAYARDEAHRFSNLSREKLGKRMRPDSALSLIKGIGKKTMRALYIHLGDLEAIKQATDEKLALVPGVTKRQREALRQAFHQHQSEVEPLQLAGEVPIDLTLNVDAKTRKTKR